MANISDVISVHKTLSNNFHQVLYHIQRAIKIFKALEICRRREYRSFTIRSAINWSRFVVVLYVVEFFNDSWIFFCKENIFYIYNCVSDYGMANKFLHFNCIVMLLKIYSSRYFIIFYVVISTFTTANVVYLGLFYVWFSLKIPVILI